MFTGLSAFPLSPLRDGRVDVAAFERLIELSVAAKVDSICALGSTGNYAYLNASERAQLAKLAVEHAAGVPVIIGIGALSTRDVLARADEAQGAGASAVLLAPMSYQKLTSDEVFTLYETVTRAISVPLVVYDNPGTTHFEFSDELHWSISKLPNIGSIKIPALSVDPKVAKERVARLRSGIPPHVTIGISGDAAAAGGITAGCEVWYSVIGGLFPEVSLALTRLAQSGNAEAAAQASQRLEALWSMFRQHGSLRVVAAAAEILGYTAAPCLPAPLRSLQGEGRKTLHDLLGQLDLA